MTYHYIGGEFEINPAALLQKAKTFNPNGFLFSSGRIALHAILNFLKKNKNINELLLPDYLCESIIQTAQNNHFKISFYQLDKNLELNKHTFQKKIRNKALLVINYFGLKKTSDSIAFLKNNTTNCPIILDNVQAFFEMFNETDADYSFASFRKYFPVPDGGWLRTKEEDFYFDYSNAASIFSYKKLIGGILKYYSSILPIEDEIYLQYLKMGEDELNNYKKIATISKESLIILSNLNIYFEDIISQRNTNAIFVLEQLKRLEIDTLFPINAPVNAPLAIPIQIKNRNIVYNRLIKNKIYLPIHWHVPIEYKTNIKRGNEIAQNELSIVIDQRYSPTILHRIFEALHQCKEDKLL